MATIGTKLNLLDLAKRQDPDGTIAQIVEMLAQKNEILNHIPMVPTNLDTGYQTTVRTGLPTPTWSKLNAGEQATKSTTAQIVEATAILSDWSMVDSRLVQIAVDKNGFLLSESSAHIEGIAQEWASTLFYGTQANSEEFIGFSSRYSSLSAANASNIINGSGAQSDNSSIWLIDWDPNALHGTYPRGMVAGVQVQPKGEVVIQNAGGVTGAFMDAYLTKWMMAFGLVVRDWRHAVRICNLDISALRADSSAADLRKLMRKALHRISSRKGARFYMNRDVREAIDVQALNDLRDGGGITPMTVDGVETDSFGGVPIYTVDALTIAESVVS